MRPSEPVRYAPIFASGRTGFTYDDGARFDGCAEVEPLMQPPRDGFGRQPGVAFRLASGGLVIARPLRRECADTVALARAA